MTIEGVTGYGYSSQGNVGQDNAPRGAETDAGHGAHGGAQAGAQVDDHAEDVAQDASYDVPGYEASAATCFKRAADIAKSLNHQFDLRSFDARADHGPECAPPA